MIKVGKLLLVYDESEFISGVLQDKLEELAEECLKDSTIVRETAEREIVQGVYEDYDLYNMYFDDFKYELGQILFKRIKTHYTKVIGVNMGWRHVSGTAYVKLADTEETASDGAYNLICAIVPKSGEFTMKVHNYGYGLYITVCHHDNPVGGDQFYVLPCAESTYRRNHQ